MPSVYSQTPGAREWGICFTTSAPVVPPEMIKDFMDAEIGVVQSVTWENNKANETLESSEEIKIEKPGKKRLL